MKMRRNRKAARQRIEALSKGPEKWVRRGVVGLVAALAVLTVWFAISEESEQKVIAAGSDIRLPLSNSNPASFVSCLMQSTARQRRK